MIYPSNEFDLIVLRLNVSDEWTVQEFSRLLSLVVDAYEPIELLRILSDLVDQEPSIKAREPVWNALYSNQYSRPFGREFSDLLASLRPFSFPLTVGAIRISSPGFIELIGTLNPVKTIADFISSFRAENTKRMDIDAKVQIAAEHEATERMRIKAELAQSILDMMPKHARLESAHRVIDISNAVIEPSIKALDAIAGDERVKSVDIRRLGSGSNEPNPQ